MTKRDDQTLLRHMLDSAREAQAFVEGKSRDDLSSDRLLALGVVKAIEVVGEAARGVSHTMQAAHPDVAWREIVGMRNRLVHDYTEINFDIVWQVATTDLPMLVRQLEHIVDAK